MGGLRHEHGKATSSALQAERSDDLAATGFGVTDFGCDEVRHWCLWIANPGNVG